MNKQIKQISFGHDPETAKFDELVESNDYLGNIDDKLGKNNNKTVEISEHLVSINDKLSNPLKFDKGLANSIESMAAFLHTMKGDKGDRGEIGPTGGIGPKGESIVGPIGPKGDKGESIVGPAGADGRDGRDGADGEDGRDGRDGADGINPDPKEVIFEIKKLQGNDRLDISNIRNAENISRAISKFNSKQSQMLHGGGISVIRSQGVDALPSGGGWTALDFIGAGVTVSYVNGVAVISITATGSGGGGTGFQVNNETPGGAVDGNNKAFTLANTPVNNSLMLYVNGQLQSVTDDYTIVAGNITMINAPMTNSVIRAFYQYTGTTPVNNETPAGSIDGNNVAFTLAHSPSGSTLMLYLNGQLQTATVDYTLVG